jgi:hypothetical protein
MVTSHLPQAEERQNRQDHDDKTDEINDAVHGFFLLLSSEGTTSDSVSSTTRV